MSDEITEPDDLPTTAAGASTAPPGCSDPSRLSSTAISASTSPSCSPPSTRRPGPLVASGIEPGDRVAIWAPELRRVGRRRARRSTGPGRVLVPLNTRFKGPEAAYVLNSSPGPHAVHGHRLPRHRLRRAARRPRRASPPRADRGAAGPGQRTTPSPGPTSSAGADAGRRRAAAGTGRRHRPRRPRRHLVHLGHHRRAEGRHARATALACGPTRLVRRWSGSRRATAT